MDYDNTHIFLVDDDPVVNMVHQKILQHHQKDIKITIFRSGQSALEALLGKQSALPGLVLLDINMPMINGWEFMDEVYSRKMPIRVVILTSSVDQNDLNRAKKYPQILEYIPKPLTIDNASKITDVLSKAVEL